MLIVFKKPYIYWTFLIFVIYILLSVLLSGFYNTIPLLLIYAKTVNWFSLILSILFTLVIGILVSVNGMYGYILYKEREKCMEGKVLTGAGTLGGLAAGVCPLCVTGLFPFVFGLFGFSFSFASLPFKGLEIQVISIIILSLGLHLLRKTIDK